MYFTRYYLEKKNIGNDPKENNSLQTQLSNFLSVQDLVFSTQCSHRVFLPASHTLCFFWNEHPLFSRAACQSFLFSITSPNLQIHLWTHFLSRSPRKLCFQVVLKFKLLITTFSVPVASH